MREEKKPICRTFYRIGCLFMVLVFLTVSLDASDREKLLFAGNPGLFDHIVDDNSLFKQEHSPGINMSNRAQIDTVRSIRKPSVSHGKFFGEVFLGMVGNIVGGYSGVFFGHQLTKEDDDGLFDGFGGAILGYFGGSTFGSALGVVLIGNSGNAKGSFGSALLGSLLGEGAAIALSLLTGNEIVAVISFIALPPIGAALLFNSSLRYKSLPGSHALLNFNKGDFEFGIPYVRIQPLPSLVKNVKPAVRFDVNLVNIMF